MAGSRPQSGQISTIHRYRVPFMVVVGAAAVMAAAAWGVVLLSPPSAHPVSSGPASDVAADAPMTTLAANPRAVPVPAQAAGQAMVQLRATTVHGVVLLTGVAVAEGGVLATTADALKGMRSLAMVGTDGHLVPAKLLGLDAPSDVALVSVPDDVPVAPFADDVSLGDGAPDWTLSLATSASGIPALQCQPGSINTVGSSVASGPAGGMAAIVSSPAGLVQPGDPLLNKEGEVIGLFYDDDSPGAVASTGATFLPSELVLGVADDLRSSGRVAAGWPGVQYAADTTAPGAMVMTVDTTGPAAGRLQTGEVIVGVNSLPVRTVAELRARLYVLAPGSAVALTVVDGAVHQVVDITLGASP